MLSKMGVALSKQTPIMAQQKSHNYQLAFIEHYKAAHPGATPTEGNFGNHPNAWFASSVKASSIDPSTPSSTANVELQKFSEKSTKLVSVSP